jgi:hypothetical protein
LNALIYQRTVESGTDPRELAWLRPYADAWVVHDLTERTNTPDGELTAAALTHTGDGTEVVMLSSQNSSTASYEWLFRHQDESFKVDGFSFAAPKNRIKAVAASDGTIVSSSSGLVSTTPNYGNSQILEPPYSDGNANGVILGANVEEKMALATGPGDLLHFVTADSDGLSYQKTSLATLQADEDATPWETVSNPVRSDAAGAGIAVAADGRVAISFYRPSNDSVNLALQDPDGTWTVSELGNWRPTPPLNFDFTDGVPSTDVAFLNEEPHVVIGSTGLLSGVSVYSEDGGFEKRFASDAEVVTAECASNGQTLHVAWRSRANGESNAEIGCGSYGDHEVPATRAVSIPAVFEPYDEGKNGFSLSLDGNGFPKIATILNEGDGSSRLIVAQPGDSLDEDGDGLPLLAEAAYGLDAEEADSESGRSQEATRTALGGVRMRHRFQYPQFASPEDLTPGMRVGGFLHRVGLSSDLRSFFTTVPLGYNRQTSDGLPLINEPGLDQAAITLTCPEDFIAGGGQFFSRLEVRRLTPIP